MSQKVNPFIFRVILNRNWSSSWYVKNKFFSKNLLEDFILRNFIYNYLNNFFIIDIVIQKSSKLINIFIILNEKRSLLNSINFLNFKNKIISLIKKDVYIDFINIKNPNVNLALFFYKLKNKISNRKSYKTLIKNIFYDFFSSGGIGIKIIIKGRLNGSIMSKKQIFKQGKLPLQRISADIRYYCGFVKTIYGIIGIKLWSYMGNLIY